MSTEKPNASRHRRRTAGGRAPTNTNSPTEPMAAHVVWRVKYDQVDPVSSSATTDDADSTITRPSRLSTATVPRSHQNSVVAVPGQAARPGVAARRPRRAARPARAGRRCGDRHEAPASSARTARAKSSPRSA